MTKILSILCFSIVISQNFIYDSEDWYAVKKPGYIYSITQGPFQVYFGTDNGIFSYDMLEDIVEYDYQLNRGLEGKHQIFSIHYDSYSDQLWIVTNNGVFYKNPIFNNFNKVNLKKYDTNSYYNFGRLGSINNYLILESSSGYIFIDSFSGSQVSTPEDFDQNSIVWSSSYYNDRNDIDVSKYYADDWHIGFQTIVDSYGNEEFISVYFEDTSLNIWFGTNKGRLVKGYKYSNKVEVRTIGPFSDHITSLGALDNGNWFLSSGRFKRHGRDSFFNYNKQSNPFISIWNEYDNTWVELNEIDFPELNNPDVNYIYPIEDKFLVLGLMEGLIVLSVDNYSNYNFIDQSRGLNDDAVFKINHYNDKVFLMTSEGISVYSTDSNMIIEENILSRYNLNESDILDMVIADSVIYFSTKSGLYLYDIDAQNLNKITDSIFYQIEYKNNRIYCLNHHLSIININDYSEEVFYYGAARNFEISGDYVWLNLKDRVKLINLESKEEWVYDHNDGFTNIEVFDIIDDGNWVCFLTSNGLMFYNWSNYHY
tara:strand:- start:374 stop:1990 length:1617 start_codon:yes stop_codon:yes gene_type:complete